jgi:TusA-related sulfurtransferase
MTTHHFHLLRTGGTIEVVADNPSDAQSLKAIRNHMAMIAGLFSQSDFSLPMFIHANTPPGIETMKRLRTEITYHAEDTPRGAQVRITTKDPEALRAIHRFLRFQIEDHRTNDPLEVQE